MSTTTAVTAICGWQGWGKPAGTFALNPPWSRSLLALERWPWEEGFSGGARAGETGPLDSFGGREARLEQLQWERYSLRLNAEFASIFKLGRAERLQLVQDLWDSIAQKGPESPVPDSKREELHRRKERLLQNPSSGRTWEQVKRQARAQHG